MDVWGWGLGRRKDAPDSHDYSLTRILTLVPVLPSSYTAPSYPILDQGMTPRCVAYSGSLTRIIEERKDERRTISFDSDDLYRRCKAVDGYPNEDGTDIRTACKVLMADGALITKSRKTSEVGSRRKIAAYARLSSIDDIKQAIFAYRSAWLGSTWYNSWFNASVSTGILPTPDSPVGGHAYTAIGWSDKRQAFRCQNSWGPEWCQRGRFWLPYKFVDFTDFDAWRTVDVLGDT